jgi:hypothetical protein
MKRSLNSFSDEELVDQFATIARHLGEIVVNWLPGDALETRRLFETRNVLRHRGQQSRLKLAVLLQNNDRFVRYYTARELFGLLPQPCRSIIEENTKEFDAIAGDARGFLRAIDEGTFKPT